MIEIPLNSSPEQIFSITLEGSPYDIRVKLNSRTQQWSISFSRSGVSIVNGVALAGGVDIVQQYALPIRNMYVINLDDGSQDPTSDNLGTAAKLFMLTDEEVDSVTTV